MGILPGCCSGTFRLLSVAFLSGADGVVDEHGIYAI